MFRHHTKYNISLLCGLAPSNTAFTTTHNSNIYRTTTDILYLIKSIDIVQDFFDLDSWR